VSARALRVRACSWACVRACVCSCVWSCLWASIGVAPWLAAATPAEAQAPALPAGEPARTKPTRRTDGDAATDALERALQRRDFAEADRLIDARLAEGVRDPILLYNSACVLAQLGKLAAAEQRLMESLKAGFRDFDTMEADEDLEPIRASRTYEAIMEARERLEKDGRSGPSSSSPAAPSGRGRRGRAPDPVAAWKAAHPEEFTDTTGYRYDKGADGSIAYATFLDEASHERMKRNLDALGDHLLRAYFGKPPSDPVLVAIVRPSDAKDYLERPEVRGMYLHSARRLVSRDAGQSLQHEFVHLMHFAHMERTGQRHPIWVQEGLASLYEDYTLRPDGGIEFHPNIRFNIARKQVTSRTAMRWSELFALSGTGFMNDADRLYPLVRSIFEFLARERKLEEFYRQLGATWSDDPDGRAAIEKTFGEPLARVEERWRTWMTDRGEIDDSIERDDASLGITIEDAGDGVRIKSFVIKSAAKAAGLRVGDVIIEVDGTPVRNRDEMLLVVAKLEVGRKVAVRFRRDDRERSLDVTPRALGS